MVPVLKDRKSGRHELNLFHWVKPLGLCCLLIFRGNGKIAADRVHFFCLPT